MRLVGADGAQVGVVSTAKALKIAAAADLDLVEVAPNANPPVCKVMNFSKYKYEAAQKARESRKNQSHVVLKEVRFRLKIDDHDYLTKTNHAKKFLESGDKVKAMIQFRGREQQRPELGLRLLERFAADVADISTVESAPRQDGRAMVMVLSPLKTKSEAKRAAREAAAQKQKQEEESHEEQAVEKAQKKKRVEVGDSAKKPKGSNMSQKIGDVFGDLNDLLLGGELSKAEKRELAKQQSRGTKNAEEKPGRTELSKKQEGAASAKVPKDKKDAATVQASDEDEVPVTKESTKKAVKKQTPAKVQDKKSTGKASSPTEGADTKKTAGTKKQSKASTAKSGKNS